MPLLLRGACRAGLLGSTEHALRTIRRLPKFADAASIACLAPTSKTIHEASPRVGAGKPRFHGVGVGQKNPEKGGGGGPAAGWPSRASKRGRFADGGSFSRSRGDVTVYSMVCLLISLVQRFVMTLTATLHLANEDFQEMRRRANETSEAAEVKQLR